MSKEEFDFYLTVPAPEGTGRVLFPFHVLARPQAIAMSWDWSHMMRYGALKIRRLRKECNRHAEKAGLGEPGLNQATCIYWMAAYLSREIRDLKATKPNASEEEILWLMVDEFGLPRLPWGKHAFSSSFGKEVHGTSMRTGIEQTEEGEEFDPLVHIDLSLCTIKIESWATNNAKYNYDEGDVGSIRSLISKVPLLGPFWKVDASMGNEPWMGEWDRSITTIPPSPGVVNTSLVDLEPWISGTEGVDVYECGHCNETFKSPGLLIQHCRLQHNDNGLIDTGIGDNDGSNDMAQEYYDNYHKCDICQRSFNSRKQLVQHKRYSHAGVVFTCDKCGKTCNNATLLYEHLKVHEGKVYKCTDCGKEYKSAVGLRDHRASVHEGKTYACDKCGKVYTQRSNLSSHRKKCQ